MIEKSSKSTPPPQPKPQPQPRPEPKPTYKRSLWQRFKDGIEAIGEWFEDDADTKIAVVLYALALISYVVVVVAVWVDDGFFSALITGIIYYPQRLVPQLVQIRHPSWYTRVSCPQLGQTCPLAAVPSCTYFFKARSTPTFQVLILSLSSCNELTSLITCSIGIR